MRMTPRVAGAFGRVGFRATSPRIAPHSTDPAEDEFVFAGHIAESSYKFQAKHHGLVVIGFFGRDRGASGHNHKISATYNGRPMTVSSPTYVGADRGVPGFAYITDAVMNEQAEVIFTVEQGELHTGALKVMNPHVYEPVDRDPGYVWSGNGGAGANGMQIVLDNGIEQVLIVGGYGGTRTPIRHVPTGVANYPPPAWITQRSQLIVDSTVIPGSKTSVAFSYFETQAVRTYLSQRPNNFSLEDGYGLATFSAKDLGLTSA